jgi:RNA polymerase sigma-70 factor (ECF subfamily)
VAVGPARRSAAGRRDGRQRAAPTHDAGEAKVNDRQTALADDDLALIERTIAGDHGAFEALMHRHERHLYRAAHSILRDERDAEEAVLEAWWKAYRHLQSFRAAAKPSTWLTRITINEALMRQRRNKARAAVIQPAADEAVPADEAADGRAPATSSVAPQSAAPDQLASQAEMRRLIERRVDALPEIYRAVFVLRAIDGMDTGQIAIALELPAATVRVRLMRARRMLQAALRGDIDARAPTRATAGGSPRSAHVVAGARERVRDAPPRGR